MPTQRYSRPKQLLQRTFKRQLRKFCQHFAGNFYVAFGSLFICLVIMWLRLKELHLKQANVTTTKSVTSQPLAGHMDLIDPSPLWKDNLQFEMPEIEYEVKNWHDFDAIAADKQRTGAGEAGTPVTVEDDSLKELRYKLMLENGFNALASDLISVNRSVPDVRHKNCHKKLYMTKLPTVSVVISARNEYKSVLQRTLHSIANRTPKELLKEIIIVDDSSHRGYAFKEMSDYAENNFPNLVKIVHLKEHMGPIEANVAGAKMATADVIVFLDSHIECNYNWLPPLLEPIATDDRITTSPFLDIIQHDDFAYKVNDDAYGSRSGFNWDLTYTAIPLRLQAAADVTKPYKDIIRLTGIFAISRRFFWDLGGFDVGIKVWNAALFEMSFKIWMCGGMLLVVPCSHVGHIRRGAFNNERAKLEEHFIEMQLYRHRAYSFKYSHFAFKRQFRRCVRLLTLNIVIVFGIAFLGFTIIGIKLNKKHNAYQHPTERLKRRALFEPLVADLNLNSSEPHWNENLRFNPPAIKGERKDWHDYAAIAGDSRRRGRGEQGAAVVNTDNSLKHIEEHLALENGFNAFISDLISVNRSLKDVRMSTCHMKRYLAKLPSVSIVIPCRNEYKSVLQRTLHSIYNRTPKKLLKEIIIVDDNSFRGYTVDDMTEYADYYFPNLVKFVRLYERKGLIYARTAGARVATGDVLIFFDSHIECNYNWLPPLLEPIAINDRIVTSPIIDNIQHNDFAYASTSDGTIGSRGGFNWDLTYLYMPLPMNPADEAENTKPYKDPVMLGGLFAISRRFFWELGGYDIELSIWGAEQFEISFKIWMCGGMLLVVPCSHVGHIFRGPRKSDDVEAVNEHFLYVQNKRIAEVWMDDYKKYVYNTNIMVYDKLKSDNLSTQHDLRKRLNCNSFQWYLEFIANDMLVKKPIEVQADYANGTIQSMRYPHLCVDNLNLSGQNIGVFLCAEDLARPHPNQFWNFNYRQEIKNGWNNYCLDVWKSPPNADVSIFECHQQAGNQFWFYDKERKLLIHGSDGNNCLEIQQQQDKFLVFVNVCNFTNLNMKWNFGFINNFLTPEKFQPERI